MVHRAATRQGTIDEVNVRDGLLGYNAFLFSDGPVTVLTVSGVVFISYLIRGTGNRVSLLEWARNHPKFSRSEAVRVALITRQVMPPIFAAFMGWLWLARPTSVSDPDIVGNVVLGLSGVLAAWGRWRFGRDSPPVVGMPRWFREDPSCWNGRRGR